MPVPPGPPEGGRTLATGDCPAGLFLYRNSIDDMVLKRLAAELRTPGLGPDDPPRNGLEGGEGVRRTMTANIRLRILLIRWLALPLALLAIALPGVTAADDDNDDG